MKETNKQILQRKMKMRRLFRLRQREIMMEKLHQEKMEDVYLESGGREK